MTRVYLQPGSIKEEAPIYRRLTLVPLLMTFRGINVFLFALGTAALVATIASWPLRASGDAVWASYTTAFTLKIAFAFLPASLAASLLMPSASSLVPEGSALPTIIRLLLLGLGAITLLEVPGLFTWWLEDRALLRELIGSRADPSGLDLIPSGILLSMPFLAAGNALSFALSSILGNIVRAELSFRVLAADC